MNKIKDFATRILGNVSGGILGLMITALLSVAILTLGTVASVWAFLGSSAPMEVIGEALGGLAKSANNLAITRAG